MADNSGNPQYGFVQTQIVNPQDCHWDFNWDDDVLQSAVADLSACFDDSLFYLVVNEQVAKSKVAM